MVASDTNASDSEDDQMWAENGDTEESKSIDNSFIVQFDEDQEEV